MFIFFFQAEDGIRDAQESRGLGDVYKRQVEQVIGQVVDVKFNPKEIPSIHNALIIEKRNQKSSSKPLVLEVQSHLQDGLVRCISIQDTSGLQRGCLLYTSDAADDLLCVDLGGRRII